MSLLVQSYGLGRVSMCAYIFRQYTSLDDPQVSILLLYFCLELNAYIAFIVSNVIFFLFRSCCKHQIRIEPELPRHRRLVDNDTIIEIRKLADTFKTTAFLISFEAGEQFIWKQFPLSWD